MRAKLPGMHVHAFSPLEVWQGAKTLGVELPEFLSRLNELGTEVNRGFFNITYA